MGGGDHHLPWHKQVVAGAFAGLCEILIMYPLDVVKTRFQLHRAQNPSIPSAFRSIVEKEGASRLYRGIAAPILAEAPKRAIKFTANEQYKKLLRDPSGTLSGPRAALAGVFAGMTEAVINCPFEVVKVRMQAKENIGIYRSSGHAAATILKTEGFTALYYGFESMLWRNGVWNGVYFGTINQVRKLMPNHDPLLTSFLAGTIAGSLATACNTPMDVAKSRIQSAPRVTGPGVAAAANPYVWVLPSMVTILRTEGWQALYKGLGLRLLRLGPGGGIMLLAFDLAASYL